MGFPIEADIIEQVKKVVAGEKAEKVTTSHPPVDIKESGFEKKLILRFNHNHTKGMLWMILLSLLIYNYRSILAAIKSYF